MRWGMRFTRVVRAMVLVGAVVGSLSWPLHADDTESGIDGEQIVPVKSKAIRMASERVDVDVTWGSEKPMENVRSGHTAMRVTAEFELVNDSDKPQSIMVSFPDGPKLKDFTRTVDGKPVKVEERPNQQELNHTSKIDFAPRQTRRVGVKYVGCSTETTGEAYWSYILKTGAHWKGKIGQAIIVVHFPDDLPPPGKGPFDFKAVEMTPEGYSTKGRTATWVLENFKPAEDVKIVWTSQAARELSDPFKLKSRKDAAALLYEQGQTWSLRTALEAFAAIREFYPDSAQARTLDYDIAKAFADETLRLGPPEELAGADELRRKYARKAIARYEAALKEPLDENQRRQALANQFILCVMEAPDKTQIQRLQDRIKKETLEEQVAFDLLDRWGERYGGNPLKRIRAMEAARTFFPESWTAKTIDYQIATVYWQHGVCVKRDDGLTENQRLEAAKEGIEISGPWRLEGNGPHIDAGKAITHYEASLNEPLNEWERQGALAELFVFYSVEAPDAAKAQKALDTLARENMGLNAPEWPLKKIAAVSPQKAIDALNSMPGPADKKTKLLAELKEILAAHPNGLVPARTAAQAHPAEHGKGKRPV